MAFVFLNRYLDLVEVMYYEHILTVESFLHIHLLFC